MQLFNTMPFLGYLRNIEISRNITTAGENPYNAQVRKLEHNTHLENEATPNWGTEHAHQRRPTLEYWWRWTAILQPSSSAAPLQL